MRLLTWTRGQTGGEVLTGSRRARKGGTRQAPRVRLALDALEDRCVPSTFAVTSTLDDAGYLTEPGTLRYAVANAQNGDTIVIKGSAAASGITLTQGELVLTQQKLTIKTQGDSQATISGGGLSRVFEIAPGADVTLKNLTVTGGTSQSGNPTDSYEGRGGGIVVEVGAALKVTGSTVTGNSALRHGGGIADYGTLTVDHSVISNNQALGTYGGGISVFSGDPFSPLFTATLMISDSSITGNTAFQNGGGITGVVSTVTIKNCDVSHNTAQLYDGGGLNNHGGVMTVKGGSVSSNTTNFAGGGIFNHDNYDMNGNLVSTATLTVKDCTLSHDTGSDGGALSNLSTATLENCSVLNNTTIYGGGGIENFGTATIKDCTLSGNVSASGGAINNIFATLTVKGGAISGNTADNGYGSGSGGGINNIGGTVTIRDCLLTGNNAGWGGGIFNDYYATATVTNCVLAGNTASAGSASMDYNAGYHYGGAIFNGYFSTLTIKGDLFDSNTATDEGGGLMNDSYSTATVIDCVFSNNTSTTGAAIFIAGGGSLTLKRSTFFANTPDTIVGTYTDAGGNSGL